MGAFNFQFNITTWGWIHLIVGAIVLLAGFGVFTGAVWARTVGVIMAYVAALVGFACRPPPGPSGCTRFAQAPGGRQ